MKAVNLLPPELRRGGGGGAGHSGGLVYVLLGALGVIVVLTAAWAVTGRQINDRQAEAARLSAQAAELERRAGELVHYEQAATAAKTRVDTVRTVASARFQWARALRDVSRVIPADTWLTKMTGTIAPGVSVEGGVSDPLRASLSDPAIEINGCSRNQTAVAKLITDLRAMKNVTRVALSSSQLGDASDTAAGAASSGSAGTNGEDCRYGRTDIPQFSLVIFFKGTGQVASSTTGAATAAAPAQTPPKDSSSSNGSSDSSSTPDPNSTTASTGAAK